MGKYFGTDGFRGEANKVLTFEHAIQIGRFLGWYYGARVGKKAKVVIGKDTRRSSYMFEYALCTGLMASGADAYIMHVTTTPSVAYITRVDDFDCGIMISASHNPYYDNGIKLLNTNGEKMDEETILQVEDYIDGKIEIPVASGHDIGRTVDYVAGRNRYIGYLISMSKFSFKNKRVGLDVANGAAWSIAKGVFDALGAKTYVMNAEPDGYNINTDCGSTHIEHLQKFVVDNGLDVGFAYDGDADRCLCVDEKGNVVTGDGILTSLKMMEVMLAKDKPLSELAAPVVFYPQVLKNVRVKSKPDAQNDPDVQAQVQKVAEDLGDDGRILVRESGTEPVIRVMVEAGSDDTCEKLVDSVIDVIKDKGHLV